MAAVVVLATGLIALLGMLADRDGVSRADRERQATTKLANEVVRAATRIPYAELDATTLPATLRAAIPSSKVTGSKLMVARSPGTFTVSVTDCSPAGVAQPGSVTQTGSIAVATVTASGCPATARSVPPRYKRVLVTIAPTDHAVPAVKQTIVVPPPGG